MKQLMAGGGVALIGITLVPLLSGCLDKKKSQGMTMVIPCGGESRHYIFFLNQILWNDILFIMISKQK